MIKGVPVGDIAKQADPISAAKLTVVLSYHSFDDEEANWAAMQVVRGIKQGVRDLEVAQLQLPSFKILPDVSNDPDDARFAPDDQFPLVWQVLKNSDIVLLVARESRGLPSEAMVRLIERIKARADEIKAQDPRSYVFKSGNVASIVLGGNGACHASMMLSAAFNKFGLGIVRHGIYGFNTKHENIYKSEEAALKLDMLSKNIIDLCV